MPDAVMLFAAGFGTRMGPLTQDRPKPLIPVAGRPLLDHALTLVREFSPRTTVVNAHYKADQIVKHLDGSRIHVSVEAPDILDTGGGLKAALPVLSADAVFTMNTDAVWKGPNPLRALQEMWKPEMQALLLCVPKHRAVGHNGTGDFNVDPNGIATWGSDTVYTGVQILRTNLVSNRAETVFSLKAVWQDLAMQNALHATVYNGLWCDVGHPDGIGLAEEMLAGSDV